MIVILNLISPFGKSHHDERITKTSWSASESTYGEGEVPKEWKNAHTTHIFQNGSITVCNNYRPVSLTSMICKLVEKNN